MHREKTKERRGEEKAGKEERRADETGDASLLCAHCTCHLHEERGSDRMKEGEREWMSAAPVMGFCSALSPRFDLMVSS